MFGGVVRVCIVILGIILCSVDFLLFSKQKMIASFAFVWGVFSVILILAGILDGFTGWLQMFPARVLLLVFLFLLVLIWMLYSMSLIISDLTMKNQELAMQVSLLNNENEKILKRVKKLTESENLRKQGRKI